MNDDKEFDLMEARHLRYEVIKGHKAVAYLSGVSSAKTERFATLEDLWDAAMTFYDPEGEHTLAQFKHKIRSGIRASGTLTTMDFEVPVKIWIF